MLDRLTAYRPRATRDHIRGRIAADKARAAGAKALDCAFAAIEAQFGIAGSINSDKRRAEALIRRSFGHPETRARFHYYAAQIADPGLTLDQACDFLRAERTNDPRHSHRLAHMIRSELHIILRWLRAKRMHRDFADMVDAMRAIAPAPARSAAVLADGALVVIERGEQPALAAAE